MRLNPNTSLIDEAVRISDVRRLSGTIPQAVACPAGNSAEVGANDDDTGDWYTFGQLGITLLSDFRLGPGSSAGTDSLDLTDEEHAAPWMIAAAM